MVLSDTVHKKSSRPRGRPREFDENDVLDRAMMVFRRHGFDGATMERLSAAMSMNKPSIYRAFGDRRALYDIVIARYGRQVGHDWIAAFGDAPSPQEAILEYFRAALDVIAAEDGERLGCLVVTTMPVVAGSDDALRETLQDFLTTADTELAAAFENSFGKAIDGTTLTALDLAGLINGTVHSLAVRAQSGASRSRLDTIAESTAMIVAHTLDQTRAVPDD